MFALDRLPTKNAGISFVSASSATKTHWSRTQPDRSSDMPRRVAHLFVSFLPVTELWMPGVLLRLQCMDDEEAGGEAEVHASQSGAKTGESPEQWPGAVIASIFIAEAGPVKVNEDGPRFRFGIERVGCAAAGVRGTRPSQKGVKDGHPLHWSYTRG